MRRPANFQTTYGQMPGDTRLVGGNGNLNRIVNNGGGTGNWYREIAKYWSDLSTTGLAKKGGNPTYTNDFNNTSALLTDDLPNKLPLVVSGTNAYVIVAGVEENVNFYIIGTPTAGGWVQRIIMQNVFKPSESLAYDKKADDGLANTGSVIGTVMLPAGLLSPSSVWNYPVSGNGCATAAAGDDYKVATTTNTCTLAVRIGSTTGNLQ